MNTPNALDGARLYRRCDLSDLPFETTADLDPLGEVLGQSRALKAIEFGIGIGYDGYNIFVLGAPGIGKHTVVELVLRERSAASPAPSDWCYVHNFEEPQKPISLGLPAGRGAELRQDMAQLIEDLRSGIPGAFQSEAYRTRTREINEEFKQLEEQAFQKVAEKATSQGIGLLRTPTGYTLAPVKDEHIIGPEEYEKLPSEEQQRLEKLIDALKEDLKETIRQVPIWKKKHRETLKQLNRDIAEVAVGQLMRELRGKYGDLPAVLHYFDAVATDVAENIDDFRGDEGEEEARPAFLLPFQTQERDFTRYEVNLLVNNRDTRGAPVIYEDNPNFQNVIGRVEHVARLGTLSTNFTLIKPGALHKANGGYLILDARKLLTSPFAWEGLKRVLRSGELRIESVEQILSLASTTTLQPETIPLTVKVVLTGERLLYYLLKAYDPDFSLLFKVSADFAEDLDRGGENTPLYARLVATVQQREKTHPIDRGGVARIIEHCARQVEDADKLSLHMGDLSDLIREADYWAGQAGSATVRTEDVQQAIDAQVHRVDQIRERVLENIERNILMIQTRGAVTAQVNGLSVLQIGDFMFGRPSRITATARLGEGEVVDIEREVEFGGPIHSKGVLILSSYLANRYSRNRPLSLNASLVFEQSYGMVEGDSASAAELCALLSALAEIPMKQSLAVTGSVNQLGQIQPIGGVNAKIEGFFDICRRRDLSGDQGVIIPASNVQHLMLRVDVVEAAQAGRFHVYPVEHVDQVMELLSGLPAGEQDAEGNYPEGSINHRVQQGLKHFAVLRREFAASDRRRGDDDDHEA